MKLHLGCGPVYLKEYVNIDARADFVFPNVPEDIFNKNQTTFDNYYKYDFGKGSAKTIVDVESDIMNLSFPTCSVDEIVLMHVLEHIPQYQLPSFLNKIRSMLKEGGKFIIGVPDIKGFSKMLTEATTPEEEDWCIRLIYCTQRDKFCHHFCGYTERTIKELLEKYGFGDFVILPNINFYPAIHLTATKIRS